MNMCRFSTKDDDGYEKFSGTLAKYINDIKTAQHETGKLNKDGQSSLGLWFDIPIDGALLEILILFSVRYFEQPRLCRAPITRASIAEYGSER